jgi:bacterioferritin
LNREIVLGLLNAALSTELGSLVRCKRRYYSPELAFDGLREEFLEQAIEESMHTDRIVERIIELGGLPDFSAHGIADFSPGDISPRADLRAVINEDLDAQRLAVESYRNIVQLIGPTDEATCGVLEDIIHSDQQFIDRLSRHLTDLPQPRAASQL